MKVKSTLNHNISVFTRHKKGAALENITVPAGATLELSDDLWKGSYTDPAKSLIEVGALVVIEEPKLSVEEADELAQEQLDLAEKALAAAKTKAAKAKKAKAG